MFGGPLTKSSLLTAVPPAKTKMLVPIGCVIWSY